MNFSQFGEKFTRHSGILQLMDDITASSSSDQPVHMLGGGNPGIIPEAVELYQECMQSIVSDTQKFTAAFSNYDTPRGRADFIHALVSVA